MLNAKLIGTETAGALGEIPVVLVATFKPHLKNNGFNSYAHPAVKCDELYDALPACEHGTATRQGHVVLKYATGGGHFLTFASMHPSTGGVFKPE